MDIRALHTKKSESRVLCIFAYVFEAHSLALGTESCIMLGSEGDPGPLPDESAVQNQLQATAGQETGHSAEGGEGKQKKRRRDAVEPGLFKKSLTLARTVSAVHAEQNVYLHGCEAGDDVSMQHPSLEGFQDHEQQDGPRLGCRCEFLRFIPAPVATSTACRFSAACLQVLRETSPTFTHVMPDSSMAASSRVAGRGAWIYI